MKIAFCGAGGTGKSTSAKLLAAELKLPLIPSPSRACFEKHGVLKEDDQLTMSPEKRYLLQYDIFEAIKRQYREYSEGIFERTLLDNYFYLLFRCHDIALASEIEYMKSTTIASLESINALFYFPLYPSWTPQDDGMRTMKSGARELADMCIQGFLDRHLIDAHVVPDATPEQRLDEMMGIIGRLV